MDPTNHGTFIDLAQARKNVSAYLSDTGKMQLDPDHPEHVIGHVFGLTQIKDLLHSIEQHNAAEKDPNKKIAGLRMYNSKSTRTGSSSHLPDLTIVPVTKAGDDYPDKIHKGHGDSQVKAPKMILAGGGPCPNVC